MTDEPLDLFSSASADARSPRAQVIPFDAISSVERDATHVRGSVTSQRAAEAIEPQKRHTQKEKVFLFLLSCGRVGATRREIAICTGLSENSIRPRILELVDETDPALGTPRVSEDGTTRDNCAVLFAGAFARDAHYRLLQKKAGAA